MKHSRNWKLRMAKQQIRQNGQEMPGAYRQSDLIVAKCTARDEDRLPVDQQELEVQNSDAYNQNKQKASQSRKHLQRRKESFEWNYAATDTLERIKNIRHTGKGKHQAAIDFFAEEGDVVIFGKAYNIIPKGAVGIYLQEGGHGYSEVLVDGKMWAVKTKILRPMGQLDDDE